LVLFLAILSAASFAATKAAATRGVVTGTPAQGMVLTNPVGVVTLVLAVVLLGEPCTMLQMMGGAPSSRSACVRRLRRLLGPRVIVGSAISLAGASAVAVDGPQLGTAFSGPSPREVPHANPRTRAALRPQSSQRDLREPVD